MTDARRFPMGIRVDLTLLLPERVGQTPAGPSRYIERDELLPIGSVDLAQPELLKPTRTRVVTTRGERRHHGAQGPDPFRSRRVGGTRTRKDALLLGEFDLGNQHEALQMSLPSGLAEFDSIAYIPGLIGATMDTEGNPNSEPDTCDVTVRASDLPLDLRILRGAQIDAWTYTHGDPSACKRGQPGYFGGIIRDFEKNRNDNTVSLACVDYTWTLQQAKVTPAMLAVKLDQPFPAVVYGMLEHVPGAASWKIFFGPGEGVEVDTQGALRVKSKRERITKKGRFTMLFSGGQGGVTRSGGKFGIDINVGDDVLSFSGRKTKVSTVVTVPTVGHILGTKDKTVWTAILQMSALMGFVPNVRVNPDGDMVLSLMTAEEVQLATFDNPRVMTDGVNIMDLAERASFDGGPKVDAIEVRSLDADTGRVYKGRAGRLTGGATSGNIEAQTAHGLTSDAACEARAAELWRSYWQAEFSVDLTTSAPWSVGGGPDVLGEADPSNWFGRVSGDSDLLFARSGEAVRLTFDGLEGAAKALGVDEFGSQESVAQAHDRLLRSRGVPEESATRIAEAMQQVSPSQLFAIRTISHSFDATGDGSYECRMQLDAFLGHPEDQLVVFRESAEKAALGAL